MKKKLGYFCVMSLAVGLMLFPYVPMSYAKSQAGAAKVKNATVNNQKSAKAAIAYVTNTTEKGLLFNFRGVPLDTVLDYLSQAAGFVIIRTVDVNGTIDVWSHQPLDKEEAVDLVNTVLNEKGYAAIRNGRTLTIVKREDAKSRNIPVKSGSNPDMIPKNDELVTQIIPVRYVNAVQLIEDLKPLKPDYATMTANESSNAIVLTDVQTNIRRMAEIVKALDTSLSSISAVRVFPLKFADATELAKVITDIFTKEDTNTQSRNNRNRAQQFFARMAGGGQGGGPGGFGGGPGGMTQGSTSGSDSEALKAVSHVVAVGDQNTNSLVVSAPDELMPTIENIVNQIDVASEDVTELRVFHLKHADAQEMADMITNLFPEQSQSNQSQNQGAQRFGAGFRFGGGGTGGTGGGNQQTQNSERKVKKDTVLAVADLRTNSVIVSAASDMMEQVARMIEKIDEDPSKKQNVYIYKLQNADVDNVAEILRNMFEEQNGNGNRSSSSSTRRTTQSTSSQNQNRSSNNQNSLGSSSGSSNTGFGQSSR